MGPSTKGEDTIEVEVKLLEIKVASHALSTTSLSLCGGSLTPSKEVHSNSHMVESLISLKWWGLWLSSHGNRGNSSYMGLVVNSFSLSIWWHMSLNSSSYVAVVEGKIPCSTISSPSPWMKAEDGTSSLASMTEGKIPCSVISLSSPKMEA